MAALDPKDFVPMIDVSHSQGDIDFTKMRAAGVPYTLIRAGIGRTVDDRFAGYMRDAKAAGMIMGVYWHIDPRFATGRQHAELFEKTVRPFRASVVLPWMVDIEPYWGQGNENDPRNVRGQACLDFLIEFLEHLEDIIGERPLLYGGASGWGSPADSSNEVRNTLELPATDMVRNYDWILARYPAGILLYKQADQDALLDPATWPLFRVLANHPPQGPPNVADWEGWQFAGQGDNVGDHFGVGPGDVDLNIIRKDAMKRWLGVHSMANLISISNRMGMTTGQFGDQSQLDLSDSEDDMPIFIRGDAAASAGQQEFPFRGNGAAVWERVGASIYVHLNGSEQGNEADLLNRVDLLKPLVVPQAALDGIPDQFRFTRESYLALLQGSP